MSSITTLLVIVAQVVALVALVQERSLSSVAVVILSLALLLPRLG